MKCSNKARIFVKFNNSHLVSDEKLAKYRLFFPRKISGWVSNSGPAISFEDVLTTGSDDLIMYDSFSNLIQSNSLNKC